MSLTLTSLEIPIDEIPMEGAVVRGSTDGDIFELDAGDAQPLGPVNFDLKAYVFDEILRVEGKISGQFELECTRCLDKFPYDLEITNYDAEVEIENRGRVDLTERIREDMLLSLPAYPHCDASSDERECPVGDRFAADSENRLETDDSKDDNPSSSGKKDVWSALDDWKQNDKQ